MPIAITERNVIAARPLQLRVIYLQPRPGNFNQMPVAPVPRPQDCGDMCMDDIVGFSIGLTTSGILACAGAGALPWAVWGLGYKLNVGIGFGMSIAGAIPGLVSASGTAVWACKYAE